MVIVHEKETLVLAIRGTKSKKDVLMDAVAVEISFLDGFAHKGIVDGVQIILSKVQDAMKNSLENQPGYNVVVTGHSLGGGAAELVTMELLRGSFSHILPEGTQVTCIALAPPPVFRSESELPDDVNDAIEVYINNQDVVPRFSLSTMATLLATMNAVHKLGLGLREKVSILRGKKSENRERLITAVRNAKQEDIPMLHHCGQLYHLLRRDPEEEEEKYCVYKEESETFSRTFLIPDKCTEEMHSSELVKANYTGVPGASSECWWHNAAQAFNPQAEMPGTSSTCVKSISHRIFNISLKKLNQILKIM